jgi:hypothetical protein
VKTPPPERKIKKLAELMEFDLVVKKKADEQETKNDSQKAHTDKSCSSQLEVRSNYSTKSSKQQITVKHPEEVIKEKAKPNPTLYPKNESSNKPPTGKPKKKEENLLSSIDDDVFDLLSNKESEADFVSSISSNSSQIDYDKMAIDAMEEIIELDKGGHTKSNSLHNYEKSSNWATPCNQNYADKIKTSDIDIIEEDIENEIDSEYSMTFKRGEHNAILASIKREIEVEEEVGVLDGSKDSDGGESFFGNVKVKGGLTERRRSRRERVGSIN